MSASPAAFLALRGVSIRYGSAAVVEDMCFDAQQGEFITLLGPSGSGKTSILRAIAGFVRPERGDIFVGSVRLNDLAPYEREIGMVFQNFALFPHMNVRENIAFGLKMRQMSRTKIAPLVDEALHYVRLAGYEDKQVYELSGGQQQRVAIARALVIRPRLLLLDEPMSSLDALLRASMQTELLDILSRAGVTTLYVTHNQDEALSMSDRIVVMASGQVRQIGAPAEIYARPADAFVAGFVGQSNLVQAKIVGRNGDVLEAKSDWGGTLVLKKHAPGDGRSLLLLLRPEHIQMRAAPRSGVNSFDGCVAKVTYTGAFALYRVRLGDHELLVQRTIGVDAANFSVGDQVSVSWDPLAMVPLRAS
jgi:ABC-type Fe3+/spermidine/putrescine transport system ATPase subunit